MKQKNVEQPVHYCIFDQQNNLFFAGSEEWGDTWTENEYHAIAYSSLSIVVDIINQMNKTDLFIRETSGQVFIEDDNTKILGNSKRKGVFYNGKKYYGGQKDIILKK